MQNETRTAAAARPLPPPAVCCAGAGGISDVRCRRGKGAAPRSRGEAVPRQRRVRGWLLTRQPKAGGCSCRTGQQGSARVLKAGGSPVQTIQRYCAEAVGSPRAPELGRQQQQCTDECFPRRGGARGVEAVSAAPLVSAELGKAGTPRCKSGTRSLEALGAFWTPQRRVRPVCSRGTRTHRAAAGREQGCSC